MMELYTLVLLSTVLVMSPVIEGVLASWFKGWPTVLQTSVILLLLLLIYLVLYLVLLGTVNFLDRRRLSQGAVQENQKRGEVIWPGSVESLAWPGHLILAMLLLLGLLILIQRPAVNPVHLALLAMGCVISLSTFVTAWLESRRPPLPAGNLALTPGSGFIGITWTPPNDPHYAESLLVRSPATFVPIYPWHGDVLCRGVLSTWWDGEVEPGVPYQYVVFTHDGQGRYRSTMGQIGAAFPLPDPPVGLAYVPERHAIRLSWKIVNPYDVHSVQIVRRMLGGAKEAADKQIMVDSRESWRDSGLPGGTRYEYSVYSVDADGQQSVPAKVQAATLAEPIAAFEARVLKRNRVVLTWQVPAEAPAFQDVVVTRLQEGTGAKAREIYIGTEGEHVDRGLRCDTAYVYAIQARYTHPIRSEPKTVRVVTGPPPAGVEDVEVEAKRCSISLRWVLPKHESVSQVMLARLEYSPADDDWVEQELLTERATEYTDYQLEPGSRYTYALYVQASDGHWSAPVRVDAETLPPPMIVSNVKATYISPGGPAKLTWRLPDDETIIGTHTVRQQDRPPTSPANGAEIFHGAGTQVVDESVTADHEYYYALFTYDDEGFYSRPVYKRIVTYELLVLWIRCPDLNRRWKVRLPAVFKMRQIVGNLLKRQGVSLDAVSDWTATIEESARVIAPEESLREAGIQSGQTVCLTYMTQAVVAVAPEPSETAETSETGSANEEDLE